MAGFDFDIQCVAGARGTLHSLLAKTQSLARARRLRMRYAWRERGYHVTVDGSSVQMEALLAPLLFTLWPYAEALPAPLSKRCRVGLATRLIDCYAAGVRRMQEALGEVAELTVSHLGGYASPGSFTFDVGRSTHLRGQARGLMQVLRLYGNGSIPPAEVVEIAHTTAGGFLVASLGPSSKTLSFEQRARRAAEAGHMSPESVEPLVKLNRLRRRAKHQGQRVRPATLDAFLMDVVSACHHLARTVRQSSGGEPEGPDQ